MLYRYDVVAFFHFISHSLLINWLSLLLCRANRPAQSHSMAFILVTYCKLYTVQCSASQTVEASIWKWGSNWGDDGRGRLRLAVGARGSRPLPQLGCGYHPGKFRKFYVQNGVFWGKTALYKVSKQSAVLIHEKVQFWDNFWSQVVLWSCSTESLIHHVNLQ